MNKKLSKIRKEDLPIIARNTDWRAVFRAFVAPERSQKKGNDDDWWASSPFANDSDPSFHMNEKGWYCHSTGRNGDVIDLVAEIEDISVYEAALMLIEGGYSIELRWVKQAATPVRKPIPLKSNPKIDMDLRPFYGKKLHQAFVQRGIFEHACKYVGCGYLPTRNTEKQAFLANRLVFQIRAVREGQRVIVGHIGRATTKEDAEKGGKWKTYRGFHKTAELYNADNVLLDDAAREQLRSTRTLIIVEGCFDVLKCIEAGILNVVGTLGSKLSREQVALLKDLSKQFGGIGFVVWYDSDEAGVRGAQKACVQLSRNNLKNHLLSWSIIGAKGDDPCDLSTLEIANLSARGLLT